MATVNRSATSRFARSVLRSDGLLPMLRIAEIPVHDRDRVHRVLPGQEGRLDVIAQAHYGESELGWIIALASGIKHIQRDVTLGLRLRVPARETVRDILDGKYSQ